MNNQEMIVKIHLSMNQQCKERGYATPVDVLMQLDILTKSNYEQWRLGKIPFLESVCTVNLHKLSFALHQMRVYAQSQGLKPSFCYYKQWAVKKKNGQGRAPVIPLRFSKYDKPEVERGYATHFVVVRKKEQVHATNAVTE